MNDTTQSTEQEEGVQLDWKDKEHAAEELLFYVETLDDEQVAKLNIYADSFYKFIEEHLLASSTLKVLRIGLRLVRFMFLYFVSLAEKTSMNTIVETLLEMFNDHKGLLRKEVQNLFVYLSRVMNLRSLLLEILSSIERLTVTGKASALKTVMIVLLSQY